MGFDLKDICRGYSSEQYSRAIMQLILDYLESQGLINKTECISYVNNHLQDEIKKVVDSDRETIKNIVKDNKE